MAQLDNGFVPFNDPIVEQYVQPLLGMIHGCHDTPTQIANEATVAKRILDRHGYPFTYLELVRAAARSIPVGGSPVQCSDVLAALVVLLTS